MPVKSTTKTKPPAKATSKAPTKKASALKKKPASASKANPASRRASGPRPKAAVKRAAAAKPVGRKAAAQPATITVGETQYVLGEYGQLMTMDEYERVMGKKSSG